MLQCTAALQTPRACAGVDIKRHMALFDALRAVTRNEKNLYFQCYWYTMFFFLVLPPSCTIAPFFLCCMLKNQGPLPPKSVLFSR